MDNNDISGEKAPVNLVPAAAEILRVLALYLFIGRKGFVDANCLLKIKW